MRYGMYVCMYVVPQVAEQVPAAAVLGHDERAAAAAAADQAHHVRVGADALHQLHLSSE